MEQNGPFSIARRTINVSDSGASQRLDNYLLRVLKGVPRSRIYRLIRKGQIRVNGARRKVHQRLVVGDIITLPPIRVANRPPKNPLEEHEVLTACSIYEDEAILVIDKPTGVAVHGGSGIDSGLIETLRYWRPAKEYLELVHRLDKETSGCLLLAKDPHSLRSLHHQFRGQSASAIRKTYISLLAGRWTNGSRKVDDRLMTIRTRRGKKSISCEAGRHAETHFTPLEHFSDCVSVRVRPKTGRLHQIRAHAALIGFPVAGDHMYGHRDFNKTLSELGLGRLFLHASELIFNHPSKHLSLMISKVF